MSEAMKKVDFAEELPTYTWQIGGTFGKVFLEGGISYKVIVELEVSWPEISLIKDGFRKKVIQCLNEILSREGLPEIVKVEESLLTFKIVKKVGKREAALKIYRLLKIESFKMANDLWNYLTLISLLVREGVIEKKREVAE